jgi:hypothetical protein
MTENYLDFDKFLNEAREEKGPVIKVYNREYQLPVELPAVVMVSTLRMLRSKQDEVAIEELMTMVHAVFGKQNVDFWLEKKGMGFKSLSDLLEAVIKMYQKTPSDQQPIDARQRPNSRKRK